MRSTITLSPTSARKRRRKGKLKKSSRIMLRNISQLFFPRFAVEYLERRSRWKRSLKGGAAYEDDLTTPAHALTPGAEEEFKEVCIEVI